MNKLIFILLMLLCSLAYGESTQYYVSPEGSDESGDGTLENPWQSPHKALSAIPFDEDAVDVNLREGTYILPASLSIDGERGGSHKGTFRIRNYPHEEAVIDGREIEKFSSMISITNASHVTLEGLDLNNLTGNKSGIYVSGSSSNIRLYKNTLHDMYWTTSLSEASNPQPSDNLNPLVILGNSSKPMTNISVIENRLFNLLTGYSEGIKIVGNVDGFLVEGNELFDVTNICIVAAGNYTWVGLDDPSLNQARNGIIRGNNTYRCLSPVAASAGIYVDGGRDIQITDNHSHHNTVGFSVGSEQPGTASGIVLTHNTAEQNEEAGLVIGTFNPKATVSNVIVKENEFRDNFTRPVWGGAPLIFSNVEQVTITDNLISSNSQYMITSNGKALDLNIDQNTYTSSVADAGDAVFAWVGTNGENYFSFNRYKRATGMDSSSTFTKE